MKILSRFSGEILFEFDTETIRVAVEAAIKEGADLLYADLRGANLQGADLRGACLHGANLQGADLRGACLHGANLQGADLRDAELRGADLQGSDLRYADLQGADLLGADCICIEGLKYRVIMTATHVCIGCRRKTWGEWRGLSGDELNRMDPEGAELQSELIALLDFWEPRLTKKVKEAV